MAHSLQVLQMSSCGRHRKLNRFVQVQGLAARTSRGRRVYCLIQMCRGMKGLAIQSGVYEHIGRNKARGRCVITYTINTQRMVWWSRLVWREGQLRKVTLIPQLSTQRVVAQMNVCQLCSLSLCHLVTSGSSFGACEVVACEAMLCT